jgi:chromosome segregation ATPase
MDDPGATAAGQGSSGREAHAKGGGAKELTKEQLLGYIKKLKQKVKEVENDLQESKTQHAALQAGHLELEERAAVLGEKDRAADDRLIQAAEDVHRVQTEVEGREKVLQARVAELEHEIEAARRTQDGQIEQAERAKRAEGELRRAQERIAFLEAAHDTRAPGPLPLATPNSESDDKEQVARLQEEKEEMQLKLKLMVDRYKTLQVKAKSVVEEKAGVVQQLEALQAATAESEKQAAGCLASIKEDFRQEKECLAAEIATLSAASEEARNESESQAQMLADLRGETERMRSEQAELTAELVSLREKARAREEEAAGGSWEASAEVAAWRSRVEALETARGDWQMRHEDAMSESKKEKEALAARNAALAQQLEERDSEIERLTKEAQASTKAVQELQAELEEVKGKLAALEEDRASEGSAMSSGDGDRAAMAVTKAALEEEKATLQERLEGAEKELKSLRAQMESLQSEGEAKVVSLRQELAGAEEARAEVQGRVEAVEAQRKEQDETVKRLKTLLSKSRSIIQSRDQEISKSKAAAEALTAPPASFKVAMRVRTDSSDGGPAGTVWCLVVSPPAPPIQPAPASSQDLCGLSLSSPGDPSVSDPAPPPASLWVAEEKALAWTREALARAPGSVLEVSDWPVVLQEGWAQRESSLRSAMEEEVAGRRAMEEEFHRYRGRAHAALKKATERSGEERQRDRALDEEKLRLAEERAALERTVISLEEELTQARADLEEIREAMQARLEMVEHACEKAVKEEAERGSRLLEEAAGEADRRLQETVAEWTQRVEAQDREGDALEEKIAELEGQLQAAQAAVLAARDAVKAAVTAGASTKGAERPRDGTPSELPAPGSFSHQDKGASAILPAASEQDRGHRQAIDGDRDGLGQGSSNLSSGRTLAPLKIPPPPLSDAESSSGVGEGDAVGLGEHYVVIKQLTGDFQKERVRDLQLIAHMQEEITELNAKQARLQEQERGLKAALQKAEDSLARERELHAGPVNAEYLKHAIYGFLTAHTDTERQTLLSVIVTMLHFSPEEAAKAKAATQAKGGLRAGVTGWITAKLGAGGSGSGESDQGGCDGDSAR